MKWRRLNVLHCFIIIIIISSSSSSSIKSNFIRRLAQTNKVTYEMYAQCKNSDTFAGIWTLAFGNIQRRQGSSTCVWPRCMAPVWLGDGDITWFCWWLGVPDTGTGNLNLYLILTPAIDRGGKFSVSSFVRWLVARKKFKIRRILHSYLRFYFFLYKIRTTILKYTAVRYKLNVYD
jgi:hypothetical protein